MLLDQVWKHHLRSERARVSFSADNEPWVEHGGKLDERELVVVEMAAEDEIQTVLVLFAAAEAALQDECERIANQYANTPVGGDLAAVFQAARTTAAKRRWQHPNPNLAPILDVLQRHGGPGIAPAFDAFREMMNVKHWLAHGRYWNAPPMVDATAAWASIRMLFMGLGFPMPAQPTSWV